MIETYLLEHLAAFSKYQTLSETAEHLHLTQPTLTRSMNKLEDLLGVTLFIREKKRLRLNDNGILAAKYAEEILDMQEQMFMQVRTLDRLSRTITVGANAPGPIMELMPLLTNTFTNMTVSTELQSEEELIKGLKNNTYQMIILNHPMNDGDNDFYQMKCGSEQLCASLVPTHPLADASTISFRDMNGESFLMAAEVGIWDSVVRTAMPQSKFLLQEDLDALREITNSSSLSGFSTDLTLRILGGRGSRINIPFSDPASYTDYYCICLGKDQKKYQKWYNTLSNRMTNQ